MKHKIMAAVFAAALAAPAAATTLDFTAGTSTSGSIVGTTWNIAAVNGSLTNATHKNNVGCTGEGWDFACSAVGNRFDVGFGVNGTGSNNNEIDGRIPGPDEFVQVTFGERVQVTGFAGMLTYDDVLPLNNGDREQVRIQYRDLAGNWQNFSGRANPLFVIDNDPNAGGNFDTVGLAFRDGLSISTDAIRIRATGRGTADDGTFNITAAGLQVAPVPVPAALPLLLAGIGALGVAARRKKRTAA